MLFFSHEYLFFFVVVLALCWAFVELPRMRVLLLLCASYYFYTSSSHWLIFLIVFSTVVDYLAGLAIARNTNPRKRKYYLTLSLVCNLSLLGAFKYFNFFAESFATAASWAGFSLSWVDLNIALPVGISFYTFQSMSYTIDIYRGQLKPEPSFTKFALFVAYFPQLIAGPIVRARDFLPQLHRRPKLTRPQFETSLYWIVKGLFKKVVLADFLAIYSDQAFNQPDEAHFITALLGVYCFAFQIYFDFSGYSDIAIGCARLMGFELPENFRRPYIARSITDFWHRWHISLSTWLRDYLYIPLGGNRMPTKQGMYRNLMITMILGGLWHGAAWHFVIWGSLQGVFLVTEKHWNFAKVANSASSLWRLGTMLLTFHLVCFSWIFFRAESTDLLMQYFAAFTILGPPAEVTVGMVLAFLIVISSILWQYVNEHYDVSELVLRLPVPLKASGYALASLFIVIMGASVARPFIYFRF